MSIAGKPTHQIIACCYYHLAKFMLPKRRFWNVEKYLGKTFCKHFSSLLAQIELLEVWKVLTKSLTHIFFDVPKSSFGAAVGNSSPFWTNLPFHDFPNYFNHESWFTILCSPNEDFGRLNKALRVRFWSTFNGLEYSIWATSHWKFVQKRTRNALFDLSKIFVWGA